MKDNWTKEKNDVLSRIRESGLRLKSQNETLLREIESLQESNQVRMAELNKSLAEWEKYQIVGSGARLKDNVEYQNALKKLEELEANPVTDVPVDRGITELKIRQSGLNDRINNLKNTLAQRDQIKASQDRETELLRQEKEMAQTLADLERIEFHIQEYVKNQVDAVETKVNAMFSGVQFKMFSDQINGGMVETCETLVNGVPWTDANNAAKINSGLVIIDTLTKHYGVSAPIWVDNAESICDVYTTESQMILLYVTNDKKLNIRMK